MIRFASLLTVGFAWALTAVAAPPATQPGAQPVERKMLLTVLDAVSGKPVSKAVVKVGWKQPDGVDYRTDASGRAEIGWSEGQEHVSIFIKHRGHVAKHLRWPSSEETKVSLPDAYTVKLEPGTSVGGRVVDDSGKAVADATIYVSFEKETGEPHESYVVYQYVQSGPDGKWSVVDRVPASFESIDVRVKHDDYISGQKSKASFENGDQALATLRQSTHELTLERGVSLEGTVYDSDGQPVSGALVIVTAGDSDTLQRKTGPDGKYRLVVGMDRKVQVKVSAKANSPLSKSIDIGKETVKLDLRLPDPL